MKKIIGILGVAVIAAAMFFSANTVNGSTADLTLDSLTSVNTANAECGQGTVWGAGSKCLVLSQICVGDPGGVSSCNF